MLLQLRAVPSSPLDACAARAAGGQLTLRDMQASDALCLAIKQSEGINSAVLAFQMAAVMEQGAFDYEQLDARWGGGLCF